jgi:hypothetical protein
MAELACLAGPDNRPAWKKGKFMYNDFNMNKFLELFAQPYWQRMWILQEIRLATQIILLFDNLSVDWTGLKRLYEEAQYEEFFKNSMTSTLRKLSRSQAFRLVFHRGEAARNRLEDLVRTSIDSKCTDPRDKIYALLGIAIDCQNGEIEINYSKSLFELYADVLNFWNQSDSPLLQLSEELQLSFNRPAELSDGGTALLSSRSSEYIPKFKLRGIKTGIIAQVPSPVRSIALMEKISKCAPHLEATRASVAKQLLETAKVNLIKSHCSSTSSASGSSKIRQRHGRNNANSVQTYSPGREQAINACLVLTADNIRTAYVRTDAQAGDIICQFPGSKCVAVLRDRIVSYEFIGGAFLEDPVSRRAERGDQEQEIEFYLDIVTCRSLLR